MEIIEVHVVNWEFYRGRGDVQYHSWFRLSNRLLEDSDMFHLELPEICAWVYILSQCSIKGSADVKINPKHAERVCRIPKSVLISAIEKLKTLQILAADVTRTVRARYANVPPQTDSTYKTDKTDTIAVFDFAALYKRYPRKMGKDRGLKTLKAQIKTQDQFTLANLQLDNFLKHLARERTEGQFIPYFSTWVNNRGDWTDPEAGTNSSAAPKVDLSDIFGEEN